MKEKFNLMKKLHGYAISSIYDPAVKVATQILARKLMRKCHVDEVSEPVVTFATARYKSSAKPSTMHGSCYPLY